LTIVPTISANRNISTLSPTPTTKIPPCGAGMVAPRPSAIAPATADPTILDGMTSSGSAAAQGIAPSVMNESPITRFVGPDERSTGVNLFLNTTVASAIASGGTIPPIMAAVIGSGFPAVSVAILN